MCLWLLTACLGLIPSGPSTNIVVVPGGVPSPILVPTAAPTAAPTAPVFPTGLPVTTAPPALTSAPPAVTNAPTPMPTPPPAMSTAPPAMSTAPPVVTTAPPAMTIAPPAMTTAPPAMTTAPPAVTTAPATVSTTPPAVTTAPPTVAPTATTLGGALLPVLLCTNPAIVCTINPNDYQTTTGPPIDPRLGTTPASSAALIGPAITAYNAQIPAYDSAVKFPRQRRSVRVEDPKRKMNINQFLASVYRDSVTNSTGHRISKRQATNCVCVAVGTCPPATNNGAGLIDIRIVTPVQVQCAVGQVYCCTLPPTTPPPSPIACGTLQTVPATVVTPGAGQANFGEFPWQALILTKQNDYVAGGVLIDQLNVLTVRHRIAPYIVAGTTPNLKVRLGEWDVAGVYEPVPFQEYNVLKVFVHPSYNALTLQYDIMVLRLASSVPLTPMTGAASTINRACLPPAASSVYTGQRCQVSGWGRNMFGLQGQYQQILKKVDVPIVAPATCQTQLQVARLGASYVLDTTSFVCAGGEANKDSCTGDGGSGLVCQVNGQWTLVGLVSWGLGCASANVPGVYVNVAALLPWIQQQVATP